MPNVLRAKINPRIVKRETKDVGYCTVPTKLQPREVFGVIEIWHQSKLPANCEGDNHSLSTSLAQPAQYPSVPCPAGASCLKKSVLKLSRCTKLDIAFPQLEHSLDDPEM